MTKSAEASVAENCANAARWDSLSGDELRSCERRLAKDGRGDLAREIRKKRCEKDRKEAEHVLGSREAKAAPDLLRLAKRLAEYKDLGLARRLLNRARLHPPLSKTDHGEALYVELFQKNALYTYKDPDLPLEWRLTEALKILGQAEDLAHTQKQETLGLAGAIYKRKWEVDGQRQNLERALFSYLRGYALGIREEHVANDRAESLGSARKNVMKFLQEHPSCELDAKEDQGYCGINAAFVLDVLAQVEDEEGKKVGLTSVAAQQRRECAALIREEISRSVPALIERPENEWLRDEWWFYATVGEAYFGLGATDPANYEKAIEWLVTKPEQAGLTIRAKEETPAGLDVPEWEYESTARQLARLARVQCDPTMTPAAFERSPVGQALAKFLRHDRKAVESTLRGRFGLGLSGGGFRASLFHIGVLARLAELDVLRHVEVLSCVSGGSIIGAYYYLEVRHLLETKTDDAITRQDYIDIVKRIERQFLEGVQRNIRTRVLAEWTTNLRMLFSSGYSRTLRVGELYERELYARIEDVEEEGPKGEKRFRSPVTGPKWMPDWLARRLGFKRDPRFLNRLLIRPLQSDGTKKQDFNPANHNWKRQNKAPILVLNATSLNTGHTWQFTASFMGEPPAPINADIDCNFRLRRLYYRHAPKRFQEFPLGSAVAASSCVPGLFEPLILDGLYPDGAERLKDEQLISVRLVDGGACDNQGVGSLLEQECTVMLVSDASGQMDAMNQPKAGSVGVLLRTNSVIQARVREAQYTDISARRRAALLRGLMFVHLRQDLRGANLAWKGCPPDLKASDFETEQNRPKDFTTYQVHAGVQRKLSAIRTDLDSFHDAEAYALMASAYQMTTDAFANRECVKGFPSPSKTEDWAFLAVRRAMEPQANEASRKRLERLLAVGADLAFKVWQLSPALITLKRILICGLLVGLAWLFYRKWDDDIIRLTYSALGWTVLTLLGSTLVSSLIGKAQGKIVMKWFRWRETLKHVAIGIGMSTIGFLAARLHLHLFDRAYLRLGKVDKIPK